MYGDVNEHQKATAPAPKRNITESEDTHEPAYQPTLWQQGYALQQQQTESSALPGNAHRQAVVRRVQAYAESHPQEPLSISQACKLAHVSRRTLQYSFESVLGISPLRFLRSLRLNQVRRALLTGNEDQTIVDAAARWGFRHAGQFAKDYKALFAESPSATLARGRK